jgi:hypothetical protein
MLKIPTPSFINLPSLEWLSLADNKIQKELFLNFSCDQSCLD